MSSSAGTKVTKDPSAMQDAKNENPGVVTSDSLAGESIQSGGSFAANADARGTINTPAGSTTTNTTDTSAAREIPPAQSAALRDAVGEGSNGKVHDVSGGSGSGSGSGSESAGTAPGYVNHPAPSMGDTFKPKGKDLKEGGFDSEGAVNASFSAEIGGVNDPGRAALGEFEARNVPVAGKAGERTQSAQPGTEGGGFGALGEEGA